MEQPAPLRQHEALVAIRLYSLLDNLINAFIPQETEITPGGYSEDIFDEALTTEEKGNVECSICYNVLKDCRQCEHGHKFCASCIFVWSMQTAEFSDKCPVCRCAGDYVVNGDVNRELSKKHVHCTTSGCNWRGCLAQFEAHGHKLYDEKELQHTEAVSSDDDSDDTEDYSEVEEENFEERVNGGINLNSSQNFSLPHTERVSGTYIVALRSSERVLPGVTATGVSSLPAIANRVPQPTSYTTRRVPSGLNRPTEAVNLNGVASRPFERLPSAVRPQSRRPSATVPSTSRSLSLATPPDNDNDSAFSSCASPSTVVSTPRPPSAPRVGQPRTIPTRLRDAVNDTVASAALSRPGTTLPAISGNVLEPNRADNAPAPIREPPPIPLALPIRRSLPIPQAARRPVAPTQPAALSTPALPPPPPPPPVRTTTAATTPSNVQLPPLTSSQRAPTTSLTDNTQGSTSASERTVETSRSHLLEVRSRLFASRQQVATILGIIAYEMDGRRRVQQAQHVPRRSHSMSPAVDVNRHPRPMTNRPAADGTGGAEPVRSRRDPDPNDG